MKKLNYKKTLAFLYKKLNNTPIAIKGAKMLHTLCDKFDKIYGIIYTKNTSSDRGNLKTSYFEVDRFVTGYPVLLGSPFFVKKDLTKNFLCLAF